MKKDMIVQILRNHNLKVTPQRIAVLEVVQCLKDHPSADHIIQSVQKNHPYIAIGTIYKTLETFEKAGAIKKIRTGSGIMRYDGDIEKHHHLYCSDSDRIEDYHDPELCEMIESRLKEKGIPGFTIEDISLEIIGRFVDE